MPSNEETVLQTGPAAAVKDAPAAAAPDPAEPTQAQHPSEIAESQLRSKGRCQAPGYKILEPLGTGTFGEVWLAEEERTGIRVAIKFFAHGAGQEWQLLQAEVKQLAQLHADPGIVHLIDVEPDGNPPYYVMAYAQQGSLAKRLEKGPLPIADALEIFRQVAEALAYVHAKGIRHCDLKPGNILIDARGRAKLADFGQAHLFSDATPALGTFFYMAPEQAELADQIPDTRWDVYGLGALMYAMLTGAPPRDDPSLRGDLNGTAELSHRLQRYRQGVEQAAKLEGHRRVRGIDRPMIGIINRCLAINPQERFRDAGAVLTALAHRERKRRQRPALIFGLIAPTLLLLVMAGVLYLVFSAAERTAWETHEKMNQKVLERNLFIAELVADDIEEKLQSYVKQVESAARQPVVRQALKRRNAAGLAKQLQSRLATQGNVTPQHLWAAHRDGKILVMIPHVKFPDDIGYQWRGWFNGRGDIDESAKAEPLQRTYISRPFEAKMSDQPMLIAISTPVLDPDDKQQIVGVLVASIALEWWTAALDLQDSFAVILNERGEYLSHHEKEAIKPTRNRELPTVPQDSVLRREVLKANKPGTIESPFTDPINNKTYVACYAPLNNRDVGRDLGWVVLIQQEQKPAATSTANLNEQVFAIALWTFIVIGVLLPGLWGWLIWMLRSEDGGAHG
jgi:eukaryotic-like serine/threonine-protein kinase